MDLLRLPVIGSILRWRRLRPTLQLLMLALAAVVVAHGLLGPQVGPRNLATVTTSIHWRGLLILGLLIAGNVFCGACPMVLARDAGRRLFHARLRWPRALRGKWLGILLLVAVLYAYELFDVWSLPAATAWIILGYFIAAMAVDMLFAGAVFCKHLCPIGQFNFVASTVSPVELRVVSRDTCRTCRTADCIKGRRDTANPSVIRQRGCELGLFLPAKVGNLDCTLCFDCVRACPHDNIALAVRAPGAELLEPGRRSGIGTLARRPDLALLAVVFVAAALVSAFAMTAPASALEQRIASTLGVASEAPALAVLFAVGVLLLPAALVANDHEPPRGDAASPRRRCVGGALRVPPADGRLDRRAGDAGGRDRRLRVARTGRARLDVGGPAARRRAAHPVRAGDRGRVRIDRTAAGAGLSRSRTRVRRECRCHGRRWWRCSRWRRCGSSRSRWRCAAWGDWDESLSRGPAGRRAARRGRRRCARARRPALSDRVGPARRRLSGVGLDRPGCHRRRLGRRAILGAVATGRLGRGAAGSDARHAGRAPGGAHGADGVGAHRAGAGRRLEPVRRRRDGSRGTLRRGGHHRRAGRPGNRDRGSGRHLRPAPAAHHAGRLCPAIRAGRPAVDPPPRQATDV